MHVTGVVSTMFTHSHVHTFRISYTQSCPSAHTYGPAHPHRGLPLHAHDSHEDLALDLTRVHPGHTVLHVLGDVERGVGHGFGANTHMALGWEGGGLEQGWVIFSSHQKVEVGSRRA